MDTLAVTTGVVVDASGVALFARVLGADGVPITQADIQSIAYTVTDLTLGTTLGTGTLPVASTVFNNLVQTDPRWTVDSALRLGPDGAYGYNFQSTLASTLFPVTPTVSGEWAGPPNRRLRPGVRAVRGSAVPGQFCMVS